MADWSSHQAQPHADAYRDGACAAWRPGSPAPSISPPMAGAVPRPKPHERARVTAVQCAQARLPPLTCGYHSADGSRAGDLLEPTGAWQWVATGYRNRRRLQTVT